MDKEKILNYDGTEVENDYHYVKEWRLTNTFPFLYSKTIICYKLVGEKWIEEDIFNKWDT